MSGESRSTIEQVQNIVLEMAKLVASGCKKARSIFFDSAHSSRSKLISILSNTNNTMHNQVFKQALCDLVLASNETDALNPLVLKSVHALQTSAYKDSNFVSVYIFILCYFYGVKRYPKNKQYAYDWIDHFRSGQQQISTKQKRLLSHLKDEFNAVKITANLSCNDKDNYVNNSSSSKREVRYASNRKSGLNHSSVYTTDFEYGRKKKRDLHRQTVNPGNDNNHAQSSSSTIYQPPNKPDDAAISNVANKKKERRYLCKGVKITIPR